MIKTYNVESFRQAYMKPGQKTDEMLRSDFGRFFIVRVEDLLRQIKLPVPPNRATTHTLIFLAQGTAGMNIGSSSFTIKKNEALIVPAGQVFSFSKLDINKGFLCNFHNDILIGRSGKGDLVKRFEFLAVHGNPHFKPGIETGKNVLHILKRLFDEYAQQGLKNPDIIQSYMVALLCELNLVYKPLSASKQTSFVTITNKFKQLLSVHIKTKQRVADYASMINVSPNHLNKAVKAATGKSPGKWIDETLILEAKVLLYQTEYSINEVAAEIGIYDQSYFTRFFRKLEGVTPMQFRRRIEKS